jgi:Tol biopolymer transport system component
VDASGKAAGDPLTRGGILELSLSPDGRRIAYAQSETTGADLWMYDTARRATSKLTLDPKGERSPLWMPDNASLVYASNQSGSYDLYRTIVGSTSPPQLLLHSSDVKIPFSVSSDGGFVLFCALNQTGGSDIWSLDLRNGNKATPLVQTPSVESEPRFAPDGKWFAYSSDESGRPEIYVQSFPPSGRKWQISIQGGTEPQWRRDGKVLYYTDVPGMLHAVDVTLGASVDAGTPRTLFPVQSTANGPGAWNYDVAGDGNRFLVSPDAASAKQREISVVLNWPATIR